MSRPIDVNSTLNIALIGAGDVAQLHMAGLVKLPGVNLYAIAASDEASSRRAAQRYHFQKYFSDYRQLLADPQVDVVHVLTPNSLHLEVVEAALQAGKHVIAEKPLGLGLDQALQLQELAENSGLICAVNFHYRHFPQVQRARALIAEGELGSLRLLQGSFIQDWLSLPTDYNWRLGQDGGGVIADIGSHWFDLMEYITGGRVNRVYARAQTLVSERISEGESVKIMQPDCASVLFEFSNQAVGAMSLSQVSPGRKNRLAFEISGSKQSIAWNVEESNDLWVGSRNEANSLQQSPGDYPLIWGGGVAALLSNAYQAIRAHDPGGAFEYPRFADAVRSQIVVEAIIRSTKQDEWVDVA